MELESLCFEGIGGAGKTTQLEKTYSKLLEMGLNAVIVPEENRFEPLKTAIQNWKKEGSPPFDMNTIKEFAKAKYAVQAKYLLPFISSGRIPLTDRSIFTAAVYQAGEISPEEILSINLNEGVYLPKKGIILLCSPETALQRIKSRRLKENRAVSLYDSIEDLNKRIGYYKRIAEKMSLEVIDSEKNANEVFNEICGRLKI